MNCEDWVKRWKETIKYEAERYFPDLDVDFSKKELLMVLYDVLMQVLEEGEEGDKCKFSTGAITAFAELVAVFADAGIVEFDYCVGRNAGGKIQNLWKNRFGGGDDR